MVILNRPISARNTLTKIGELAPNPLARG